MDKNTSREVGFASQYEKGDFFEAKLVEFLKRLHLIALKLVQISDLA